MQMCQRHWIILKEAIKERGLNHLVSADGEDLLRKELKHLEGTAQSPMDGYDPLASAMWAIMGNSLKALGPMAMNLLDSNHPADCPLCYMSELCNCPQENCGDKWIDFAADGQKKVYEEKHKEEEKKG